MPARKALLCTSSGCQSGPSMKLRAGVASQCATLRSALSICPCAAPTAAPARSTFHLEPFRSASVVARAGASSPQQAAPPQTTLAAAAAAVASVAAAGLARGLAAKGPAAAATAAAAAAVHQPATAAASTPDSNSNSSSGSSSSTGSQPLEGTPVPWAVLAPSPLPAPATSPSTSSNPTSSTTTSTPNASGTGSNLDLDLILQRYRVGGSGGGGTLRLITPRDVDAVMDMYLDRGLMDADPYWTRAWPSAIALAATLLRRPELVRGKVVADLGSGLGLAGMAAALAGAREVVLLDREPLALQCGLLSAAASGLHTQPATAVAAAAQAAVAAASAGAAVASGGGRVEPLPRQQRPQHAALRLEARLRAAWLEQRRRQQQQGQQQQRTDGEDGVKEEAVEAEAEAEWEELMARAAALHVPEAQQQQQQDQPAVTAEAAAGSGSGSSSGSSTTAAYRGEGDGSSSSGCSSGTLFRAHVFDWTAPPPMEQLLPPPGAAAVAGGGAMGPGAAARRRRFDVVLACDVLYEDAAVGPISSLMPQLLSPDGGRLLLADPPNRTARNRERFLAELRGGPLRLAVEECSLQQCEVSQLDNEMAGGLAPSAQSVPVQFIVFRAVVGNDTVGVKMA